MRLIKIVLVGATLLTGFSAVAERPSAALLSGKIVAHVPTVGFGGEGIVELADFPAGTRNNRLHDLWICNSGPGSTGSFAARGIIQTLASAQRNGNRVDVVYVLKSPSVRCVVHVREIQ